jgi:hypothetical protein
VRWNDQPKQPLGQENDWLPRIAVEVTRMGGAQVLPTPFLDPFARARRNKIPE